MIIIISKWNSQTGDSCCIFLIPPMKNLDQVSSDLTASLQEIKVIEKYGLLILQS